MRQAAYGVESLFLDRWSPRAMSGEPLDEETVLRLFEAARWAPSSMNNQPWRFVYARRDTPNWQPFFDLLVERNQIWCRHAAMLVVVLSKNTFDFNGKPSRTHSFDTGAAWQSLALQGTMSGLVVHALQGFDYDKAHDLLQLTDEYTVECMLAIGKPGDVNDLPEDFREREQPSDRRPLGEIAFEGEMPSGVPASVS